MAKFMYDEVPVLNTTGGQLKGYYYKGEYIYKGVPYAQAKRFHAPEPAKWEGVKEATSYGFVCPLKGKDVPNGELLVPHRYWPQDENCQNLNIWTTTLDTNAKKPVVVWFHGGGYEAGSSIEQVAYDGFNMAKEGDCVVVSVNHRLNILGYLDLEAYGEEYKNSANNGHADMVASLQWVHDNITLFGGDPECVTIFGQSGGGMKVIDLMQIPAADGLFHRGMIMSGVGSEDLFQIHTEDKTAIIEAMLEDLGLSSVKELETVDYYDMGRSYNKVSPALAMAGKYTGGTPLKNDWFCGDPITNGFRDHAYDIQIMVGSVYGEFTSFGPHLANKFTTTREEAIELLKKTYKEKTEEILDEYNKAYPGKADLDLIKIDRCMRQPSKRLAKLHAAGGGKAYEYMFTLEFPFDNKRIAWHCSDIPFVFHNTDKVEVCEIEGVTEKLEAQIFGAFMNFARTGNPNHELLPQWDNVTAEKEPTMIYDVECEVRNNYDDALYEKIDSILKPFTFMDLIGEGDIQH